MATLEAEGRDLGSYCPGNWCRWNAQTEKKESAWFWPLNWKSEWQTLTLWLHSLIKVSLFLPYYSHLKGFCWKHCSLGATKSRDAFDVHTTVHTFETWKQGIRFLQQCVAHCADIENLLLRYVELHILTKFLGGGNQNKPLLLTRLPVQCRKK